MARSKSHKENEQQQRKKIDRVKILTLSNIVIVVLVVAGLGGLAVIHQSDTNPSFCSTCHIMEPNVTSYLNNHTLDNVHYQAGVQCKDCHDYPVQAEIASGFNYVIGNYEINSQGEINKREYTDEMCLDCHISQQYVADSTDFLFRNPHDSHWGFMPCSECHISHGEQIDYCAACHDNGGQRMTGDPIENRGKIGSSS
ncbi:MAG: cytochrome c3 family protein [Anaerolineales bacterium]|nr:cytochrome c3 family protein [Anaerolineales bacterium]